MKKYKIIIGALAFLCGILFLINLNSGITGNAIFVSDFFLGYEFNLILNLVLIFGGLVLLAAGSLESRTDEKKYDGIIILGGNWRGYPYRFKPVVKGGKEVLDISLRSKINCMAAGEMYKKGLTGKIIIGTGQSAGKKWPSEAQAMKEYILRKYKDVKKENILIQEKTMETFSELDEDIKLARKNGLDRLALMTVNTQLPRCRKYLEERGEKLDYLYSEEEFKKMGRHYAGLQKRFSQSFAVKYYETLKEYILRGLQRAGITKAFTQPLAKVVRR